MMDRLAIASTRVLLTAVEERFPQYWGTNQSTNTAIDGRTLVYNAFNGCTEDFYDAIKRACRNDWAGAHKLFDLVEEANAEDAPVALEIKYNSVTWFVSIKAPGRTFNSPQIECGPQALALAVLNWHLSTLGDKS